VPDVPRDGSGCIKRLAHVERHLREHDRAFLPLLLMPLSAREIAEHMGPGWTRRQVEHSWLRIQATMGLREGRSGFGRIALLRMAAGIDPCVCERLASELVDKRGE
jgi:hypothetical protein